MFVKFPCLLHCMLSIWGIWVIIGYLCSGNGINKIETYTVDSVNVVSVVSNCRVCELARGNSPVDGWIRNTVTATRSFHDPSSELARVHCRLP